MTKEEVIAIRSYTGNSHQQINFMLRNEKRNLYFHGLAKNLESGLNSLPTYHGTVYRGIDGDKLQGQEVIDAIKNMKEGEIFFDKGFISTSKNINTAKDFAKNGGILLQIQNAKGHDISDFAQTFEEEILLNHGRNLIFLGKSGNIFKFKQL